MRATIVLVIMLVGLLFGTGEAQGQGFCWYCFDDQSTFSWVCYGNQISGYDSCIKVGLLCQFGGPCNGGPGGCFLGDVLISTPDGPRSIMELKVGDFVTSRGDNGENLPAKVLAVYRYESWPYLSINKNIKVTKEHPFYIDGKWVKAENLEIGDKLLMEDNGKRMSNCTYY